MTHLAFLAIKIILIGGTLAANAYYLLSIVAGFRFFSRPRAPELRELLPVSIMIPLHGAEFKAYQNYAELCRQDYPEYQIVFGVRDYTDSSIPIVKKLIADFPDRDIALVISDNVIGQNLKVSNLQNMLERVKHEQIIIVDSDIRVRRDYLRAVLAPLSDPRVGLVTCLYRAAEAPDFAPKLEAVGITAEFAAGVLMAWMLEGVKFALGSTMATTRTRLEAIGGFPALADYLADDFMLGNLIERDGYEVRLSHHVVETAMHPAGFRGMLRHQMRWGRSTRISRPMGYLGLILTYGTALALLNVAVDRASTFSLLLLVSTLVIRLTMGWMIGVHWLNDRVLEKQFWLVPVRDLMSFLIWCLSWVGRRVEWRGRVFEVARDGKMIQVGGPRVGVPTRGAEQVDTAER
ncbi:MAG TPA: bacteriohopanetetrol glucosamine biosynthesis glycosyltransferase HpnI [Blastocatellia bacterium]|nr:bacteriohopanetetrol glucosamine biosynthesis glycosyltransferase HpnI [Blastocatellia bacterium]